MKRRIRQQPNAGFTLIEMMIVVSIIGILASVAIPTFQNYLHKAKSSEAPIKIKEIYAAIGTYYVSEHVIRGGGIGNLGGHATGSRCIVAGSGYLHGAPHPHLSRSSARLSWNNAARALGVADASVRRFSYYLNEYSSVDVGECGGMPNGELLYRVRAFANLDNDRGNWNDIVQQQELRMGVDRDGQIFHGGISVINPGD